MLTNPEGHRSAGRNKEKVVCHLFPTSTPLEIHIRLEWVVRVVFRTNNKRLPNKSFDIHASSTMPSARSSKKAVVLCLFQSFAGMIFGWENSSTSGLYQLPAYLRRFGTCDGLDASGVCTSYSLPTTRQSTIAGILCIGAFLGALSSVSIGCGFHSLRRHNRSHLVLVHLTGSPWKPIRFATNLSCFYRCLHGRCRHRSFGFQHLGSDLCRSFLGWCRCRCDFRFGPCLPGRGQSSRPSRIDHWVFPT